MKRLFSLLLAMSVLMVLILPAAAQTVQPEDSGEMPLTTRPVTETSEQPTVPPTVPAATEPAPGDPTEAPDRPAHETTGPATGSDGCEHSWVYVEVKPTCTEYGARGYVCVYCEAVKEAEAIDLAAHTYDNDCDSGCNVCGAERTVAHKFSTAWSKNATQHWHACSICGAKSDEGSHYPGPAATEEKAQYCLTCGLMMMPKKAHTHVYADSYSQDETEHWYACNGCEDRKSAEPHSYDNPCDPDCNICGYTVQKEHDFGLCQFDENAHWNTCNLCGFSTEPEDHVFDGTLNQTEAQRCRVCAFVPVAEPDHVHAARKQWNGDDSSHWKLCECGEKMEEDVHTWDEGREAEDKTMLYLCKICNAEKTEVLLKESKGLSWIVPAAIAGLLFGVVLVVGLLIAGRRSGKF